MKELADYLIRTWGDQAEARARVMAYNNSQHGVTFVEKVRERIEEQRANSQIQCGKHKEAEGS